MLSLFSSAFISFQFSREIASLVCQDACHFQKAEKSALELAGWYGLIQLSSSFTKIQFNERLQDFEIFSGDFGRQRCKGLGIKQACDFSS